MPKQRKQIQVRSLLPNPVCFENITWTSTSRQGWGNESANIHAYIYYGMVQDFIDGRTCEDETKVD
jgi:hypothetical protein